MKIGSMTPKEKIDALREKLNEYNRRYYIENDPVVSDSQFDAMLHELQELEQIGRASCRERV